MSTAENRDTVSPTMTNLFGLLPLLSYREWMDLIKFRLSTMSAATVFIGYFAAGGTLNASVLFIGFSSWMVAVGAAIFNQAYEHKLDARMDRTYMRPIASGKMTLKTAYGLAVTLSLSGLAVLWITGGLTSMIIAFAIVFLYAALYTPLKQHTHWSTEIGAIAGALPPLIGWVAADDTFTLTPLFLFGITYFWQLVHFHPICFRYREDYRRAGMQLLAAIDTDGHRLFVHMLSYLSILTIVSLLPYFLGVAGITYLLISIACNALFFIHLKAFRNIGIREQAARTLFRYSLVYLPVVLCALIVL